MQWEPLDRGSVSPVLALFESFYSSDCSTVLDGHHISPMSSCFLALSRQVFVSTWMGSLMIMTSIPTSSSRSTTLYKLSIHESTIFERTPGKEKHTFLLEAEPSQRYFMHGPQGWQGFHGDCRWGCHGHGQHHLTTIIDVEMHGIAWLIKVRVNM